MRAIVKKVAEMMPYLDHEELHVLEQAMEHVSDYEKVLKLIEAELEHARVCPHCGSENVYRHGKSAGLLRYRCNACRKTFNALTNTPLARLRKRSSGLSTWSLCWDLWFFERLPSVCPSILKQHSPGGTASLSG